MSDKKTKAELLEMPARPQPTVAYESRWRLLNLSLRWRVQCRPDAPANSFNPREASVCWPIVLVLHRFCHNRCWALSRPRLEPAD